MTKKKRTFFETFKNYVFMVIGTLFAATALEVFLIPNQLIDGGTVGIAILISYITGYPLGALLFALTIPFLILGYTQISKRFVIASVFSLILLSIWVTLLHNIPKITHDLFLVTVFGGIILGIGVGLILRHGGSLDGTEIVSIIVDKKTAFSVGEVILAFNLVIFACSSFVFGWEKALYSLATYLIAFKVIDFTIEFDDLKGVFIISDKNKEITDIIIKDMKRGVTFLSGEGAFTGDNKTVLYTVVSRFEISNLKSALEDIDDEVFMTVHNVHDVLGGKVKRNRVH